jgi:hypothetical protein
MMLKQTLIFLVAVLGIHAAIYAFPAKTAAYDDVKSIDIVPAPTPNPVWAIQVLS